ncbi:hypothetical protein CRE_20911 [Caenorhabditis remanei]|uniref:Uncharacterized protein n=1 Tax=Caenorhabditis remanei TaxID=31234 RepID=E3N3R6_CAERE|nr:hypothetical protein CRE_20911 [Caenorhabditis remanei]
MGFYKQCVWLYLIFVMERIFFYVVSLSVESMSVQLRENICSQVICSKYPKSTILAVRLYNSTNSLITTQSFHGRIQPSTLIVLGPYWLLTFKGFILSLFYSNYRI